MQGTFGSSLRHLGDAVRLGAGGCHVEVLHWNCRCRSGNPAVERGPGQSASWCRSPWGREICSSPLTFTGGLHRAHSFARHRHIRNTSLRSQDIRSAMNSRRLLSNPAARGRVAAAAALAGWHGGRIANGWWQHGDGGYGWVGPLFWPFAYHDIYDYTIWGDGIGFWAYGYGDIYAGIFAPYGQDDLAGYTAPGPSGRRHRRVPPLQQLCGDDSREIAGLPIDQIQRAVQPTEAQRAALDDLANASVSAAQIVRASCPTQTASTAPARLAGMQERLQAMI